MVFTYRKNRMRRLRRKFRRRGKRATKAVDRRQDRSISKLYKIVKNQKEKKYVDQAYTLAGSTTWTNLLTRDLTYIAQGTGEAQRVGNKIKILSHHIKMIVTCGDSTNQYRFCVIRFHSQSSANIQISDALETPTVASPFNMLSFKKRNTDCKYTILYDSGVKSLAGNGTANSTQGPITQKVHDFVVPGGYASYSGSGAGDVVQGFTYLIGVTDSSILPNPSFQTVSRTIYEG